MNPYIQTVLRKKVFFRFKNCSHPTSHRRG